MELRRCSAGSLPLTDPLPPPLPPPPRSTALTSLIWTDLRKQFNDCFLPAFLRRLKVGGPARLGTERPLMYGAVNGWFWRKTNTFPSLQWKESTGLGHWWWFVVREEGFVQRVSTYGRLVSHHLFPSYVLLPRVGFSLKSSPVFKTDSESRRLQLQSWFFFISNLSTHHFFLYLCLPGLGSCQVYCPNGGFKRVLLLKILFMFLFPFNTQ